MAKNKLESAFFRFEDGNVEWTPVTEEQRPNRKPGARFDVRVITKPELKTTFWTAWRLPSITGSRDFITAANKQAKPPGAKSPAPDP